MENAKDILKKHVDYAEQRLIPESKQKIIETLIDDFDSRIRQYLNQTQSGEKSPECSEFYKSNYIGFKITEESLAATPPHIADIFISQDCPQFLNGKVYNSALDEFFNSHTVHFLQRHGWSVGIISSKYERSCTIVIFCSNPSK